VGDAILTGLQAQGLTLERLAAQAQQELAGRDLPTVARQVSGHQRLLLLGAPAGE
jgi:hypothetical protein